MVAAKLFLKQPAVNGKEETSSLVNAIRLLGAIPSLNKNLHMFFWLGWWRDVYEQAVAQVRALTTDETWEKAFIEGETLSMPQALAIALQELQTPN